MKAWISAQWLAYFHDAGPFDDEVGALPAFTNRVLNELSDQFPDFVEAIGSIEIDLVIAHAIDATDTMEEGKALAVLSLEGPFYG